MCGIFCSVRHSNDQDIFQEVLDGLKSLEYRGYDSCGLGWNDGFDLHFAVACDLDSLRKNVNSVSNIVIGHNRWSSSSKPDLENAHPVQWGWENGNKVLLVHNGTIDNISNLKKKYPVLTSTKTDSVAIAFLAFYLNNLEEGYFGYLSSINNQLKGTWAYAFITDSYPDKLFCSANGSPLYYTLNGYVSSDVQSLYDLDDQYVALDDGDIVVMQYVKDKINILHYNAIGQVVNPKLLNFPCSELPSFEKTEPHYMLEEIKRHFNIEIPSCSVSPKGKSHVIFGCGSSYNAGLYVSRIIDNVSVQYATEFKKPRNLDGIEFIAVSQSGESIDVIDVMKSLFMSTVTLVTNNTSSTASRYAGKLIDLEAGPERAVAATITFTATILKLLSYLDKEDRCLNLKNDFLLTHLKTEQKIETIANILRLYHNVIFLGTGYDYPIAREAALKMKECCYIHAESIPAAEMKHGPLAVIDDKTMCVFLISNDDKRLDRTIANMAQVRARNGKIVTICSENVQEKVYNIDDAMIVVPNFRNEILQPLGLNFVCQLLSYHIGVKNGINVDRPKNIAKALSVQ